MLNKHIHFRCAFGLTNKSNENSLGVWEGTLKLIRGWISEKIDEFGSNKDYFKDAWYFNGGSWNSSNIKNLTVETVAIKVNESKYSKYWSLRFEHPDKSFPSRNWTVDFVVEYISESLVNFSMTTLHCIRHDYIGKDPELPAPTAPKIINSFLQKFECYAGNVKLSKFPIGIKVGEIRNIWDIIKSEHRECPIILIKSNFQGEFPIDPYKLSKLLKGTANVYTFDEQDFEEELKYFLGIYYRDYNCPRGHIRIYFPEVNLKYPKDYIRHRFFTPEQTQTPEDKDEVTEIVVRVLARRYRIDSFKHYFSLEDILQKEKEEKLIKLKGNSSNQNEYISLLEDVNIENTSKIKDLQYLLNKERENSEYLILENDVLKSDIENLRREKDYEVKSAYSTLEEVIKQKDNLDEKAKVLNTFCKLPSSVFEALKLISKIQHENLFISDRAFESAHESDFDDTYSAWEALWHIGTTLRDLYISSNQIDASIFKSISGFELSLSESSLTKENKELMQHRQLNYKGKTVG